MAGARERPHRRGACQAAPRPHMKIRPLHAEYSTRSWVVAPQVLPAESLGVATSVSSCRESILPSVATASPRPARPTNAKGGAKTPPCKFIAQCAMRSTLSYYAPSGAIFAPRISKVGPVMGLRPLRGPPCIPPEAPPKRAFNFLSVARATRPSCGSFPRSLLSLR